MLDPVRDPGFAESLIETAQAIILVLDPEGRIEYAVDVSPNKRGKFVAGTGQEIVSPEFLRDYDPDLVLVMNPVYEREIASQLVEIGVEAQVRSL